MEDEAKDTEDEAEDTEDEAEEDSVRKNGRIIKLIKTKRKIRRIGQR